MDENQKEYSEYVGWGGEWVMEAVNKGRVTSPGVKLIAKQT